MWKDGFYKNSVLTHQLWYVEGEKVKSIFPANYEFLSDKDFENSWKPGSFKEAPKVLQDATGKTHFDVELVSFGGAVKEKGIFNPESGSILVLSHWNGKEVVGTYTLLSESELKEILDGRDSVLNLTCPFPKQEKGQHLIWVSGNNFWNFSIVKYCCK